MARVMRARPPRPALVPASARRGAPVAALAALLAAALAAATTLAFAGWAPTGAAERAGGEPPDPGLTAVETALVLAAPAAPSAPAAGGTRPLAALRARDARPTWATARRRPRRRPPVRLGRAQRWFARRLLEGG
jgi:hypothetical protein